MRTTVRPLLLLLHLLRTSTLILGTARSYRFPSMRSTVPRLSLLLHLLRTSTLILGTARSYRYLNTRMTARRLRLWSLFQRTWTHMGTSASSIVIPDSFCLLHLLVPSLLQHDKVRKRPR